MTLKARFSSGFRPQFLQAMLIIGAGFWVFSPSLQGGWLWDDNVYLTENPLMKDPAGLWKIWFQPGILLDYYPITFSVQRLEWNLLGADPLGYHLTTVALHLVSALLVWRLFSKLGLRLAWWGGLLFAVHPVMVESVAWISELKNTLSLPFFLLSMGAWIDYEEHGRRRDYGLALILFLTAMLCKSSDMMFPTIILLYAWWKRGRIVWGDFEASAPFFLISLLLGLLGLSLQHASVNDHPMITADWLSRVDTAQRQIFFLFYLCLFPLHLLPIYPSGLVTAPTVADFFPWLPLAGLLYVSWVNRRTWGRHVWLGLGFFLFNIVPIMGYILTSATTMIWSMDHLVYLPIIGLIGLVVAGLGWLDGMLSNPARPCVIGMAAILTALLALECHAYAGIFGDGKALWTYAAQANPGSWMVRTNLGEALCARGQIREGMEQFKIAMKIDPSYVGAHYDLAYASLQTGRASDAIQQYEIVLSLNPHFGNTPYLLGRALVTAHRIPEAMVQFEKLLQQDPQHAEAHFALGNILADAGRLPEALDHYAAAARIDPTNGEFHFALGNTLLKLNRLPEALDQYQQAARINPGDLDVLSNLGVVLARTGRIPEAAEQFETMLQIDPNSAAAHTNLGSLFLVTGKLPEATEQYQEALRLHPDFVEAQRDLARVQEMEKSRQSAPAPHGKK